MMYLKVIVALSGGQGGSEYEVIQRSEADTWQIIKMMSFGGLQAIRIEQFPNLPAYKAFGYRSQDKGFHVEQALVHTFW